MSITPLSDTLIKVKHLSFSYNGERVLDDINLTVKRGEFLGVIGPNGSGKTTLLKVLLGLLKPQTGTVELFDQPLATFKAWHKIGYVSQRVTSSNLHFPITAAEVVAMGDVTNQGSTAVTAALKAVDMAEHSRRILHELSGGQQQRVFIARALVSQPELLILDEPTAGVDVESQTNFYQLLRDLNKKMKLTLVLISHDTDVVAKEVSQVACINRTLVFHGAPQELLKPEFMNKLYGKDLRFVVHGH
jgi:zinc transport system ATP-binding protein